MGFWIALYAENGGSNMVVSDILLALSLAVDAAVVSLAIGLKHKKNISLQWMVAIPLLFGFFQGFFPFISWKIAATFLQNIQFFDHWVASILLFFVGLNMLRNAFRNEDDHPKTVLKVYTIISLAVATSIDALAVGLALPTISTHPYTTIYTIGAVTSILCFIGIWGATRIPQRIANPAEAFSGIILIALGIKVFLW